MNHEKRLRDISRRLEKLLNLPVVVGDKELFHQLRMAYTRSLPRYAAERAALPDVVRQLYERGGAEAVFTLEEDDNGYLGVFVVIPEFHDDIYALFSQIQSGLSEMDNDLELRFCARASQGRDPSECVPPNAVLIEQSTPLKKLR